MFSRPARLAIAVAATVAVLIPVAKAGQTPPTIKITSPLDGASLDTTTVRVRGHFVAPSGVDELTVNDEPIRGLGPDDTIFEKTIDLNPGRNTITATVVSGGLSTSDSIAVTAHRVLPTHKRKITLVAGRFPPPGIPVAWNGTLSAADDFGKCLNHVPVKIQRKRGDRWVTILTIRTRTPKGDNTADYFRNAPRPQGHTFRAYAPRLKFGEDICLAAKSVTRHY
jgi:hypothetical protein